MGSLDDENPIFHFDPKNGIAAGQSDPSARLDWERAADRFIPKRKRGARSLAQFGARGIATGRMAKAEEPIRHMTLGIMRRHGVRGLFVTCQHCGHERAVSMEGWPDEAPVPSFGLRRRCGKLGALTERSS